MEIKLKNVIWNGVFLWKVTEVTEENSNNTAARKFDANECVFQEIRSSLFPDRHIIIPSFLRGYYYTQTKKKGTLQSGKLE